MTLCLNISNRETLLSICIFLASYNTGLDGRTRVRVSSSRKEKQITCILAELKGLMARKEDAHKEELDAATQKWQKKIDEAEVGSL